MTSRGYTMFVLALCGSSGCFLSTDENLWRMDGRMDGGLDVRVDVRVDATRDVSFDMPPDAPKPDTPWKVDAKIPDAPIPDQKVTCPHPAVVKKCASGWCEIPAGCFFMGSPASDPCHQANEKVHETTLTYGFEMAINETTQGEFYAVMGTKPSSNTLCDPTCPVEMVTWHEAVAYCNTLSTKKGLTPCYQCTGSPPSCSAVTAYKGVLIYTCPGYRLPTEAEWEYAYRAGTKTSGYAGDITSCTGKDTQAGSIGWYLGNSGSETHPTGKKLANAWGILDMGGNVYEWVNDRYSSDLGSAKVTNPWGATTGQNRVIRGGAYNQAPQSLRASRRANRNATSSYQDVNIGFRCVKTK
jgi:sulfatase modifying factor 1